MKVLALRVAELRAREERAALRAQRASAAVRDAIKQRPILPEGAVPDDEAVCDHSLICDWHEASWESLGEQSE
jgi:hypothetical protein